MHRITREMTAHLMSSFSLSIVSSASDAETDSESIPIFILDLISSKWFMVFGDKKTVLPSPLTDSEASSGVDGTVGADVESEEEAAIEAPFFSLSEISRCAISCSRSRRTSWRRMISFSRLGTERSVGLTVSEGREMERLGRSALVIELVGECALLVPVLDKEALRERAEESSCESD